MEPDSPADRPEGSGSTSLRPTIVATAGAWLASATLLVPAGGILLGLLGSLSMVAVSLLLGVLHAVGARPDTRTQPARPVAALPPPTLSAGRYLAPRPKEGLVFADPVFTSGCWRALAVWFALVAAMLAIFGAGGRVSDLQRTSSHAVRDSWEVYDEACARGGVLARSDDLCDQLFDQRREALEAIDEHPLSLLASVLALLVLPTALVCHLLAVAGTHDPRGRRRRIPRLREFETHWSTAYAAGVGLIAAIAAERAAGAAADALSCAGVFVAVAAASLIALQGASVVLWFVARPTVPRWYRLAIAVFSVLFLAGTLVMCILVGIADLALHIRRRGSGNLDGRRVPRV